MTRTLWAMGLGLSVPLAACGALISIDDRYYVSGANDGQAMDHADDSVDSADARKMDDLRVADVSNDHAAARGDAPGHNEDNRNGLGDTGMG
jgi:hypothetical protein